MIDNQAVHQSESAHGQGYQRANSSASQKAGGSTVPVAKSHLLRGLTWVLARLGFPC